MKTYDVDYFIKKFEAIPEHKWTTRVYENHHGQHCALGHCGISYTSLSNAEAYSLTNLFSTYLDSSVTLINDTYNNSLFQQATPKARILAALNYIKLGKK